MPEANRLPASFCEHQIWSQNSVPLFHLLSINYCSIKRTSEVELLPLFEDDLNEIIDYIAGALENPVAAVNFVDEVEKAIHERLQSAESFEQ